MQPIIFHEFEQTQAERLEDGTYGPADDVIVTILDGSDEPVHFRGAVELVASNTALRVRRRVSGDGVFTGPNLSDPQKLEQTDLESDDERAGVWISLEAISYVRWASALRSGPPPRFVVM